MSYVRIQCRTSGYDIVRQDTLSYVRMLCHIRCKQNSATPHTHSTENKNIVNSLRSLWKSFWHFSVMWPKHVVLPFLMSTTFSNRTYAQTPAGTPRAEHGGSHSHLQTFGSIKLECDHFNGRPKAQCYPFSIKGHRF